jgi:hypothetical protein
VDPVPPRLQSGRNDDFKIPRPDEILEVNRMKSGDIIARAELTAARQPGNRRKVEGKGARARVHSLEADGRDGGALQ